MSKRNSAAAANAAASKEGSQVSPPSMSPFPSPAQIRESAKPEHRANPLPVSEKQKLLLSTDAGHFSLVRALHLADFITELNGE